MQLNFTHYLLMFRDIKLLVIWNIGEVEGKDFFPFLSISIFGHEELS